MRLQRDPEPTLNPHGLEALPKSRQMVFLWRFARHGTRAQVASHMAALTARPCRVSPYKAPWFETAVPGDDGLHHLWHPERGMVCGNPDMSAPQGPWVHKEVFRWKDNNRPRRRTYTTLVRRTGESVEPSLVRPGDRCWLTDSSDRNWRPAWPLWMGDEAPYTRARWWFVERLGRGCAVCGGAGVGVMDHDPFTGWVRGMLCEDCNNHIDTCPHVSGCRYADYLNDPPASHLKAEYPGLGNKYQKTLERLEAAVERWDPWLFAEIRCRRKVPQDEGLW